jgi:6-pyruvoyltetrahydropterin/6-carboxytetrahydropterin synthase
MHAITVTIPFSAGHRVLGHSGKCRFIHGHNYKAVVTLETSKLDELGFVVDFGEVKKALKNWIDLYWDHNFIGNPEDPLVKLWNEGADGAVDLFGEPSPREPYVMKCRDNPTAENMAMELFSVVQDLNSQNAWGVVVSEVMIYETDTCCGRYINP